MKRIIKWILKDFFLLLQRWENKIGKSFISDCVAAWMGKRGNCWGFLHRRRKIHDEHNSHNRKPAQLNNPPRILDNFPSNFPEVFPRMCSSGAVQSCWNLAKTRRFHDVHTLLDVFSSHARWAVVEFSAMLTLCGGGEAGEAWWKVESVNERQSAWNEKQKIMNNYTSNSPVSGMGPATLWCARCVSGKSVKIILNS